MESTPQSQAVCTLDYGLLNQPLTGHIVPESNIIIRITKPLVDSKLYIICMYIYACPMRPLPFLNDKCILYWFLLGEQIINFDFGTKEDDKHKISTMRR